METTTNAHCPKTVSASKTNKEKQKFIEDDNEDIAYLNFQMLWPVSILSAASIIFMLLSVISMEIFPHLSNRNHNATHIPTHYGSETLFCKITFPYESGMYPSILRQLHFKVIGNIFFRFSVCVPIAIRMFLAFIIRNSFRDDYIFLQWKSEFLWFINELSTILSATESCCLAIFAINNIRFDYPTAYQYAFSAFIFLTIVHMYLRSMLSVIGPNAQFVDKLSTATKFVCSIIFSWTSSQIFYYHQDFIQDVSCHGYVLPYVAINEYFLIAAYLFFNLTFLIDIRDIRFICYPRTCSGECEPLDPKNFHENDNIKHSLSGLH